MAWWRSIHTLLGFYAVGFLAVLLLNLAIGPVTVPLAILRAAVWPIFLLTGWPYGKPLTMD